MNELALSSPQHAVYMESIIIPGANLFIFPSNEMYSPYARPLNENMRYRIGPIIKNT